MLMTGEELELHMSDAGLELSLCQTGVEETESEESERLNKSKVILLSKKFQQAAGLRCSPRYRFKAITGSGSSHQGPLLPNSTQHSVGRTWQEAPDAQHIQWLHFKEEESHVWI